MLVLQILRPSFACQCSTDDDYIYQAKEFKAFIDRYLYVLKALKYGYAWNACFIYFVPTMSK